MKKLFIVFLSIILLGATSTKIVLAKNNLTKDIGVISMEFNSNNIQDVLNTASEINSIIDGNTKKLDKENTLSIINSMLNNSHEMPAFGVSIDNETRLAMQSGTWIELIYDKTFSYNDMHFDKLLIEVNPEFSGFNIIRHYNDKYEGRCFYINLIGNMKILYEFLHN